MSTPARAAPARQGVAWLVCVAVLLNGFASIVAHAAPGEILRLAGLVHICSAASQHADRDEAPRAQGADVHGNQDDADSHLRAAHCALCLSTADPFFTASHSGMRFAVSPPLAGSAQRPDASPGASPERRRAQPRAPPVAA